VFRKNNQKGQSLVEVAITLPVIILIMAGVLDLGRAYFTYVALSDAAAEGAAYAAINPGDTTQIVERAVESSNGLLVLDQDQITIQNNSLTAGSPITVTVTYDYALLTPILDSIVPEGRILLRAVVAQPIIDDES
jgi:Flp pilus assembly protein TadG